MISQLSFPIFSFPAMQTLFLLQEHRTLTLVVNYVDPISEYGTCSTFAFLHLSFCPCCSCQCVLFVCSCLSVHFRVCMRYSCLVSDHRFHTFEFLLAIWTTRLLSVISNFVPILSINVRFVAIYLKPSPMYSPQ